jgi:ATP-dependent Clp protease ATP-binding subunit ClpB
MNQFIQLHTFTEDSLHALKVAQAISKENRNPAFSAPHLLKGLLHPDSNLWGILNGLEVDIFYLEEWAEVRMESLLKSSALPEQLHPAPELEQVFREAEQIQLAYGNGDISPLSILAAIATPGVVFSYEQLKSFTLTREMLLSNSGQMDQLSGEKPNHNTKTTPRKALQKFCTDKSALAREGKFDVIIGREREIRTISEILSRRSKPNVMLVGEPGVGKSALADGFTLAALQEKVPFALKKAKIYELNLGALVAGASYKGEVEERLKNIISDIKAEEKAILFIDEIHVLMDKQGAAAGSANLLKPELARGEITLIGATTLEEYRKFIEPDEAFSRRFEVLKVAEPDQEECFHMLKAIIPYYEKFHTISVSDLSIKEAIRLAKRYTKEKKLPDSAVDLLDGTMAALKVVNESGLQGVEEVLTQWGALEDELGAEAAHSLEHWDWFHRSYKKNLSPILFENGDFAEKDNQKVPSQLKSQIEEELKTIRENASQIRDALLPADLAATVAARTGIPIGKIQSDEKQRLLSMDEILKKRIIGQDHAVRAVAEAVLESRAGLGKPGQPIGSFFLLGPTGTGKTELAKALAEFLFQDESSMIRFDMSEFKEEHAAALLYGAPPGYVGYEEGGLLVNKIREKPYAVVLFDEIEKAHPAVFDVFLQLLDEGKLHDKLGKEGDFSNAVILFTSNIGSEAVVRAFQDGNPPTSQMLLDKMSAYFRPEFLGRITEIIPFAPMSLDMVEGILSIQVQSFITQLLKQQQIHIQFSPEAFTALAKLGFSPAYGARPLASAIRTHVRRPLAKKIISGEVQAGDRMELLLDQEAGLAWQKLKPEKKSPKRVTTP